MTKPMPLPQKTPRRLRLLATLLLGCTLLFTTASAQHSSEHPLSDKEWEAVAENVSLLDNAVFIPSLLPIIMRNRDAQQHTEGQMDRLYNWRKNHYENMVNIMN